ncbi:MAG: hypothetical protein JNM19_06115 [Chitinophagaceae bacterium]|nr:hypothetical protein [Chitinophagaceae bacterium]
MNFDAQRKLGLKLASQYNAPKTLALVKDPNSCYAAILNTAAAEVGLDKLVPVLLENDPFWAAQALLHMPNLGGYQLQLQHKAGQLYQLNAAGLAGKPGGPVDKLPHVSQLKLHLKAGSGYAINQWTIWWFTPPLPNPTSWEPMLGTPNSSNWKRIEGPSLGNDNTANISEFALDLSPLNVGDTVTMVIDIMGNPTSWSLTNNYFTYDPSVTKGGEIVASGTVDAPGFALSLYDIPTT